MNPPEKNIFKKDIGEVVDLLTRYFQDRGHGFPAEQRERIIKRALEIRNYQPKIAVFGKTGSGKSSLCNAIFGRDVAAISDIEACTREPNEYLLHLSGDSAVALVDVPGVGESVERDREYSSLYQRLLPGVDLLLWVIKADDRAFSVDQKIWKDLVQVHVSNGSPVFVVLNQVDKLNPPREWDARKNEPGANQARLIAEKRASISQLFDIPEERVIPVSAYERYKIADLVEAIVFALPAEKKIPFLEAVQEEARTERAEQEAKRGFLESILRHVPGVWNEVKEYIPSFINLLSVIFGKRS